MITKKSGFSMAEMVITIAIVGVTAALILPFLRARVENRTFEAKAQRIANNIHNAVMDVMITAQNNVTSGGVPDRLSLIENQDFEGTKYDESFFAVSQPENTMFDRMQGVFARAANNRRGEMNFFRAISGQMGLEYIRDRDVDGNYSDAINATRVFGNADVGFFRSSRPGAIVIIERPNGGNPGQNQALVRIIIDANGTKGPNAVHQNPHDGHDIFVYALGNNGNMYPSDTDAFNNNIW